MANCARLTLFRSLRQLRNSSGIKPVYNVRTLSSAVRKHAKDKVDEPIDKTELNVSLHRPQTTQVAAKDDAIDQSVVASYDVERFIPVTRRALVRYIYQNPQLLSSEEKANFDQLALTLEDAITKQSNRILEELKDLYDGIDPDKDTKAIRRLSRNEILDNEFWLIRHVSHLLEKANFYKIPSAVVEKSLQEHKSSSISVVADASKYEVLDLWARGRERIHDVHRSLYSRMMDIMYYKIRNVMPPEQYRRVVAILRSKSDKKLTLKVFKDIPKDNLQALIPDFKIKMGKNTRRFIMASVGVSGISLLAKSVSALAQYPIVNTVWVAAGVAAVMALNGYNAYTNKRNAYLVNWSSLLYYKNIANNRGVLALLTDRANDEIVKEAILVYVILLSNATNVNSSSIARPIGRTTVDLVESQVSDWIKAQFDINLQFNAADAIQRLMQLGLIRQDGDFIYAISVDQAIIQLQSLSAGTISFDIKTDDLFKKQMKLN
ncbi:uncharacterized protein TRIADDRAFT_55781 [Trichoplax adhaerens]|uniref:Transmembrane protein 143 n=1 Tax=Trichoplax adhaerens TaxID=10228 RepID=B3RVU7_TRIAD|nr:hypothetical protein TRIADDRAFT_55781 [Trichoplax adhaerens]EDV26059.1 hypothetical protein TRIADDRAFT_55781 [Trichoplax adhaerens]|eukprot:XP_002112092.1 hypothetical protein TRIADDRAFT_55781 [Trichoplax adhaerens]